ncbi:DNA-directed RNA polymerase subunit beta', partial [Mycoplasma putrefaciens]
MLKVAPYRIAALLDLKVKELEEVVYFVSHIVLEAGESKHFAEKEVLDLSSTKITKTREKLRETILEVIEIINDPEHRDTKKANRLLEELNNTNIPFSIDEATSLISKYTGAKFGIGARAVEYLLKKIDLKKEVELIKVELNNPKKNPNDRSKLMKRLETLDSLRRSNQRPEW